MIKSLSNAAGHAGEIQDLYLKWEKLSNAQYSFNIQCYVESALIHSIHSVLVTSAKSCRIFVEVFPHYYDTFLLYATVVIAWNNAKLKNLWATIRFEYRTTKQRQTTNHTKIVIERIELWSGEEKPAHRSTIRKRGFISPIHQKQPYT